MAQAPVGPQQPEAPMTASEKFWLTLFFAVITPWIVAILCGLILGRYPMLAVGVLLSIYTLKKGYHNNGEFDESVGVFLGNVTDWIIPRGISWWFPAPFGKAFQKTRVVGLELDRTRRSGKQVQRVETSDGSQSEASLRAVYDIVDLLTWTKVEKPKETLSTTLSGFVRVFGLSFPASGDDSIANQKESLSKYLMGEEVESPIKSPSGEKIKIRSDITNVLEKTLGVKVKSIAVDDINPPQSIIEANEAKERENAEAVQEAADIAALANQTRQLIDLGIAPEKALVAAQAARGDIEGINVGGNAGDFAKGAAVGRRPSKQSKKRR